MTEGFADLAEGVANVSKPERFNRLALGFPRVRRVNDEP
jgi:hypothetical protein